MQKMIYIAGPMRGMPKWNYDEFNKYAKAFRDAGWAVINPVEIGNLFGSPQYLEDNPQVLELVMNIELTCVEKCDAIFLLDFWETSKGARKEVQVAFQNELLVFQKHHMEQSVPTPDMIQRKDYFR